MTLSIFKRRPGARRFRSRAAWTTALLALFVLGTLLGLVGGAGAAATAVPLGTADSFAVLAGAGITNTGPTTVIGDLGTFPTTGPIWVGLLIGVIVIVGALTFFPALALGPIADQLLNNAGRLF